MGDDAAIGLDEEVLAARLDGEDARAGEPGDRQPALVGGDQGLPDQERPELGGVAVDGVAFGHGYALTTRPPGSTRRPAFSRASACSERSAGVPFTWLMRSSPWRRRPAR